MGHDSRSLTLLFFRGHHLWYFLGADLQRVHNNWIFDTSVLPDFRDFFNESSQIIFRRTCPGVFWMTHIPVDLPGNTQVMSWRIVTVLHPSLNKKWNTKLANLFKKRTLPIQPHILHINGTAFQWGNTWSHEQLNELIWDIAIKPIATPYLLLTIGNFAEITSS